MCVFPDSMSLVTIINKPNCPKRRFRAFWVVHKVFQEAQRVVRLQEKKYLSLSHSHTHTVDAPFICSVPFVPSFFILPFYGNVSKKNGFSTCFFTTTHDSSLTPCVWDCMELFSPVCGVLFSLQKHKTECLDRPSQLANKYTQLSEMVCNMMVLLLYRQGERVWIRSKARCVDVCVNMSVWVPPSVCLCPSSEWTTLRLLRLWGPPTQRWGSPLYCVSWWLLKLEHPASSVTPRLFLKFQSPRLTMRLSHIRPCSRHGQGAPSLPCA